MSGQHAREYILTLTCAERPGIVHDVSGFLVAHDCDIVENQQFGDRESGRFFLRVHFSTDGTATALNVLDALRAGFTPIAAAMAAASMTPAFVPANAGSR